MRCGGFHRVFFFFPSDTAIGYPALVAMAVFGACVAGFCRGGGGGEGEGGKRGGGCLDGSCRYAV